MYSMYMYDVVLKILAILTSSNQVLQLHSFTLLASYIVMEFYIDSINL